jgi:hypothetical protein
MNPVIAGIAELFDTSDFPARWNCGRWSALHGWTHILADLAIASAYSVIPFALAAYWWIKRHEMAFPRLFMEAHGGRPGWGFKGPGHGFHAPCCPPFPEDEGVPAALPNRGHHAFPHSPSPFRQIATGCKSAGSVNLRKPAATGIPKGRTVATR